MNSLLALHNFKAFKSLSIELKPLTVLAGLNGTGKSTTLQALALLRQSRDAGFLDSKGFLLNGELVDLGTGSDVLHDQHEDDLIRIGFDDRKTPWEWEVAYLPDADVLHFTSLPKYGMFAGNFSGGLFGNNFQYLKADRAAPNVSYPKSHHVVSERRFLGTRGEFTAHYLHSFRDKPILSGLQSPKEPAPGLLSQTNAWMQALSPGVTLEVAEVPRTDFVRLDYSYGGSAGISSSNLFRPTNVGFGLTYALPIVVACLALPAGSWILIENPEAHLHPQGQAAMGEMISRAVASGATIIVETHSDHLLNGIRIAVKEQVISADQVGLNFFRRPAGAFEPSHDQPRISESGRLSAWPDGFFDQWDKSLDRLLP
jgi:predicted ATPase